MRLLSQTVLNYDQMLIQYLSSNLWVANSRVFPLSYPVLTHTFHIKVTGCLFVCLYQRFSLTAEPIGFSLTGQLIIGTRKVNNYFGGGYHHPLQRNKFFFLISRFQKNKRQRKIAIFKYKTSFNRLNSGKNRIAGYNISSLLL